MLELEVSFLAWGRTPFGALGSMHNLTAQICLRHILREEASWLLQAIADQLQGGDMALDYDQILAKRPASEDAIFAW